MGILLDDQKVCTVIIIREFPDIGSSGDKAFDAAVGQKNQAAVKRNRLDHADELLVTFFVCKAH